MLAGAALGITAAAGTALAGPLDALRWKSRVLVVFVQGDSVRDRTQRTLLADVRELAARDLLVVRVPENGEVAIPGVGRVGSETIRAAYAVGDHAPFTVLLVSKDGGVKQRSSEPITALELFATIDAMPMRQQEMRRK